MPKIKISEITYFPKELREVGFQGEVEFLSNDGVVVLLKPETDISIIIKSLRLIIKQLELKQEAMNVGKEVSG